LKQQYLGDVNDYRKYCLLRHFADGGRVRIGVCWMLTPDDQGRDGRKTAYLSDPEKWRGHDPELFDLLQQIVTGADQRLLGRIEASGVIPGAMFFDEIVPDRLDDRRGYMARVLEKLGGDDLIFFDPDNGIEVKTKLKGRKNSSKYLYWNEIGEAYALGHSLLIYQHFNREKRKVFTSRLAKRLREVTNAPDIWAVHTPHVVFFLVSSDPKIVSLAECVPDRFGMRVERQS
jgi:hypothetical protein